MLKLLIVDDEKIIRETLSSLIPWQDYGICLIGSASNGIEAFDMIMDEFPDIVISDIKMPGLSGLELLEKIRNLYINTEFIILSGYGEFNFAQNAMQYGVKHYLLKPCKEKDLISSILEVSDSIYNRRMKEERLYRQPIRQMNETMILNILNEGVSGKITQENPSFEFIYRYYRKFLDFENTPYELCFLYYLDPDFRDDVLSALEAFRQSHIPGVEIYTIFVYGTLLFFFPSYSGNYMELDKFAQNLQFPKQNSRCEYERIYYPSLEKLLDVIIPKIQRYETIYYNYNGSLISICNYRNLIQRAESISSGLYQESQNDSSARLKDLLLLLKQISDISLLKQLVSSVIMLSTSKCLSFSSLAATEFLIKINQTENSEVIHSMISNKLLQLHESYYEGKTANGTISSSVISYVETHLSDSNLSLKRIAERYLYMNVDYISKKFLQETGQKFSTYLTNIRIQKAKELLASQEEEKIQNIAEHIGCGNNPQYFSQLFKKVTGMTPSAYIKYIGGK